MDAWAKALLLFLASATQGFLGFGYGILAMGGLTLTGDLLYATGIVNLTGLALVGSTTVVLRRSILWERVLRIVPWTAVGVVIGLLVLESLSRAVLVRLLGLSVVGVSLWNLRGRPLARPPSLAADALAGLGSGGLSGAFNIGGPPLIAHLYRLPHSPDALRGTVQALFALTSAVRLCGALTRGQIPLEVASEALVLIPSVLAGMAVGVALGRRITPERFRHVTWVAFGGLGLYLFAVG